MLIRFRLEVGRVLPHPAFHHFDEGSCDGAPDRPRSLFTSLLSSSSSLLLMVEWASTGTYTVASDNIYHLGFRHNAVVTINIRCNRSLPTSARKRALSPLQHQQSLSLLHYFAFLGICLTYHPCIARDQDKVKMSSNSTTTKVAQAGILSGKNPATYDSSNPILIFIIQVCTISLIDHTYI